MEPPSKKLLDQVRDAIRLKHYSYRTEQTYVQWIRRFILFHNKRHPQEMGVDEIEAFLTFLAVEEQVAASTQNQTLSALLFLYRHVLKQTLEETIDAVRAKPSHYLPTVLTKAEVSQIFVHLSGVHLLLIQLLYGSGLRLKRDCGSASKIWILLSTRSLFVMSKATRAESRCCPIASPNLYASTYSR